jgi:hypothetical protein
LIALLLVAAVIALVAWALQLMQAANDRKEFSLMLAGCMVCSAAVGLAGPMAGADPASPDLPLSLPASFELPWDGQL